MPSDKPVIRTYVEPCIKNQFEKIAKLHKRSCSAELSYIIEKYLKECASSEAPSITQSTTGA